MDDNNFDTDLIISDEVIASIAMNAAKDVEGFASFADRPVDCLTLTPGIESQKYVKIDSGAYELRIHMYINVNAGAKIPDVCSEIQKAVKTARQHMTGKIVARVDITVAGVVIDENAENETEPNTSDN